MTTNENTSDARDAGDAKAPEAGVDELSVEELTYLCKRTQADFNNYRKRTQEELVKAREQGSMSAVRAFLPVLDALDLSLAHANTDDPAALRNILQGMHMIQAQFTQALYDLGITETGKIGMQFDPYKHEAVKIESQENCDENSIVNIQQQGFAFGDTIVRQAKVIVARNSKETLTEPSKDLGDTHGTEAKNDA